VIVPRRNLPTPSLPVATSSRGLMALKSDPLSPMADGPSNATRRPTAHPMPHDEAFTRAPSRSRLLAF
jgi:hypothetical protein